MTAQRQGAHAREAVSLPVRLRRAWTAVLVARLSRAEAAKRRHEPLPDMDLPHLCNVDWLSLDDPVHQRRPRRRRPPRAAADPAAERGWR